jgi:hypothetical protein
MFFEVVNADTGQGDIGLATSRDGFDWRYRRIVLDEPFHLSYPYVFHWGKEYYMIPEAWQSNSVRLYRASNFPEDWTFVSTLLNGQYTDSSLFYHNDKWWMFATIYPYDDILYLYYSDNLTGPWVEHPESPVIVGNANIARPGGRVLLFDNRIVRFTQDAYPTYGTQVWAFEIMKLTTTSYQEDQVGDLPILRANGKKWNGMGMHQIDPHQIGPNRWIACVDGLGENLVFGLEY